MKGHKRTTLFDVKVLIFVIIFKKGICVTGFGYLYTKQQRTTERKLNTTINIHDNANSLTHNS